MSTPSHRRETHLALLRPLAEQFPTLDAVSAEVARLAGALTLPKDTIHIISDIHGEHAKLRHVINNASGTLRPLVEQMFADRLSPAALNRLVTLIFYPRESLESTRLLDSGRERATPRMMRMTKLVMPTPMALR